MNHQLENIPPIDYQQLIETIYQETKHLAQLGKVADYIPALARVNPDLFGLSVVTQEGKLHCAGDHEVPFSIQSVSKLFTFTLAFSHLGSSIWSRLDREPSGTSFNSLIQLEYEHGIPRNPFINAGAIVVADLLLDLCKDPLESLLSFIQELSGNNQVTYNEDVAESERLTGHRNFALAHFMKSFGNIHNPVEKVLDIYFHQCAIEMNTDSLAQSVSFLVHNGINPLNGKTVLNPSQAKRLKALMLTTGLYNESGDFAFKVGMPAKSGVGGGIVALIPDVLSIAGFSPALNEKGNSIACIEAMERFTTYSGKSIF